MEKTKKSRHILRYILLALLVVCAGVLCGFSLSNTGQGIMQDAYGRSMELLKQNSTKQVTLNGKNSGTLTYKETMNRSDAPAFSRSDSYGSYDVYADDTDNEYVFLLNSDMLCGYKEGSTAQSIDKVYAGQSVTEEQAKGIADRFVSMTLGNDSRQYKFKEITLSDINTYYVTYSFYLDGIQTDDECVVWVEAADGNISAWHAFNRGRYDGYANRNLSASAAKAKLEEQIPLVKSADYEIFDQYITKTDDGRLVMHYDIVHHDNGIEKTHTFEAPLE